MYATLSQSYEWSQLNRGNALVNKVGDIVKNGKIITPNMIPSAMLKLKNRLKSPIMEKMMTAIADGTMVMVYSPDVKIPVYLPFIIIQPAPHTCKGYVFLNNLDASDSGDEIFLNERKLKVALESCYMAIKTTEVGNSPKLHSTAIIRCGSKIYANMIAECINRKHGIKLDPLVHNTILYMASRFFVGTMLGCKDILEPDVMKNYCFYNCHNIEYLELSKVIDQTDDADYNNIATLITKFTVIPELQKRLGKLTVANFLESVITMYDASMLLSLETFSYLFYNILAVNESTYTNNYQVLKNIVGDDGKKLYADMIVFLTNLQ